MSTTPATTDIALGDTPGPGLQPAALGADDDAPERPAFERLWSAGQLGSVRYAQGQHGFFVPHVTRLAGHSDAQFPDEGVQAWEISALPMDARSTSHELARTRLLGLLAELARAGWRRQLDACHPRLSGADSLRYFQERSWAYPLDPLYVPSPQQWVQMCQGMPHWQLWADGVYLSVEVMCTPAPSHGDTQGLYDFHIVLESEAAYFRDEFLDAEQRAGWKELLPAQLECDLSLRRRAERSLRWPPWRRYAIDPSYVDPPILALLTPG